jgi:hypothetical protein
VRQARFLIALFLLATVLVDVVAVSMTVAKGHWYPFDEWYPYDKYFVGSLALAQSGLVAVWAGFGGLGMAWRLMILVLVDVAWGALAAWSYDPSSDLSDYLGPWGILLVATSAVVFACLVLGRWAGLRLMGTADEDGHDREPDGPARWQFSLAYLFSWITAAAVVLGIVQSVRVFCAIHEPIDFYRAVAVLGGCYAAVALGALWAVLGTGPLVLRIAALAFVLAGGIAGPWWTLEFGTLRDIVVLLFLTAFWLTASLAVFRVAGYRVVRRARKHRSHDRPSEPAPA